MARNSEKAMTALARWRAAEMGTLKAKDRRPYLATECDDLQEAEKWRMQIIREISKKVSQIQNAGLGEFRIRDLNDEINKLLREKRALGVLGYQSLVVQTIRNLVQRCSMKKGKKCLEIEDTSILELQKICLVYVSYLNKNQPPPPRKTRAELMKDVDADYYGYRDDDDDVLVQLEREEEKKAILEVVQEWKKGRQGDIADNLEPEEEIDFESLLSDKPLYTAHVDVPSQEDIKEALLQKRKKELLSKYVGDAEGL